MSLKMYEFIVENEHRLNYNLAEGKIITPMGTNGTVCTSTGYLRAKVNGKVLQVHQILAVKYFGKECVGFQINHKDGNKLNNLQSNLEICTQQENLEHQKNNNLFHSSLNEDQVKYIRKNKSVGTRALADELGVDIRTIRNVINKVSWKHIA